jgi:hypothetical protein
VDTLKSLSDGHITLRPDPSIPFSPPLDVTDSLCRIGLGADIASRSASLAATKLGASRLRVTMCQDRDALPGQSTPEATRVKAAMMQVSPSGARAKQRTRRGSMMTYKTRIGLTIMRVAGSATSAMRKPQTRKRVRNDEA